MQMVLSHARGIDAVNFQMRCHRDEPYGDYSRLPKAFLLASSFYVREIQPCYQAAVNSNASLFKSKFIQFQVFLIYIMSTASPSCYTKETHPASMKAAPPREWASVLVNGCQQARSPRSPHPKAYTPTHTQPRRRRVRES
jgi:hypothetical protein